MGDGCRKFHRYIPPPPCVGVERGGERERPQIEEGAEISMMAVRERERERDSQCCTIGGYA